MLGVLVMVTRSDPKVSRLHNTANVSGGVKRGPGQNVKVGVVAVAPEPGVWDDEDGRQLRHAADSVVLREQGDQGDHPPGGLVLVAVLVTDVGRWNRGGLVGGFPASEGGDWREGGQCGGLLLAAVSVGGDLSYRSCRSLSCRGQKRSIRPQGWV